MDPEPGERVFFHGHPSWRSILGFYVKGLIGAVLAGAIAGIASRAISGSVSTGWVVLVVFVAFALVGSVGVLRCLRITYTITDRRLTIDVGLFARELHETRLERVQNVNSRQSLLERMLGIGTVDFDTAGGAGYGFKFDGVADPHAIVRTVSQALREGGRLQSGL